MDTVYRDRDGIVKRAKWAGCARIRRAAMRETPWRSGPEAESPGEERAAVAQTFLVDTVADAL